MICFSPHWVRKEQIQRPFLFHRDLKKPSYDDFLGLSEFIIFTDIVKKRKSSIRSAAGFQGLAL